MEKLKPKLFSVMKSYTKEQFVKDVIAGDSGIIGTTKKNLDFTRVSLA